MLRIPATQTRILHIIRGWTRRAAFQCLVACELDLRMTCATDSRATAHLGAWKTPSAAPCAHPGRGQKSIVDTRAKLTRACWHHGGQAYLTGKSGVWPRSLRASSHLGSQRASQERQRRRGKSAKVALISDVCARSVDLLSRSLPGCGPLQWAHGRARARLSLYIHSSFPSKLVSSCPPSSSDCRDWRSVRPAFHVVM